MSDNRKYYYLKLKENYFDDDSIVLLESMQVLRFLFPLLYSNPISCFFHFIANHLLWINCYKIVTIHLCLANTDVTGHHATGKGGRKYVFQIH